MKATRY